jgi:hypothetical protein
MFPDTRCLHVRIDCVYICLCWCPFILLSIRCQANYCSPLPKLSYYISCVISYILYCQHTNCRQTCCYIFYYICAYFNDTFLALCMTTTYTIVCYIVIIHAYELDRNESRIALVAGCKPMNDDSADLNEKELIIYIYIYLFEESSYLFLGMVLLPFCSVCISLTQP